MCLLDQKDNTIDPEYFWMTNVTTMTTGGENATEITPLIDTNNGGNQSHYVYSYENRWIISPLLYPYVFLLVLRIRIVLYIISHNIYYPNCYKENNLFSFLLSLSIYKCESPSVYSIITQNRNRMKNRLYF